MNRILVDASFLITAFDTRTSELSIDEAFSQLHLLVPQVVLVEACYILIARNYGNVEKGVRLLTTLLEAQLEIVPLELDDIARARDIMRQYADAPFDFVDCSIMALAERLNITQVFTFDRRDFGMFRPNHTSALQLLP